jgi:hypothetical protein
MPGIRKIRTFSNNPLKIFNKKFDPRPMTLRVKTHRLRERNTHTMHPKTEFIRQRDPGVLKRFRQLMREYREIHGQSTPPKEANGVLFDGALLTKAQLARELACSQRTIDYYRGLGCPSIQPSQGCRVLFEREAVMDWLRSNKSVRNQPRNPRQTSRC